MTSAMMSVHGWHGSKNVSIKQQPNKSIEPTGASGLGQFKDVGLWPLAPAAHAQR